METSTLRNRILITEEDMSFDLESYASYPEEGSDHITHLGSPGISVPDTFKLDGYHPEDDSVDREEEASYRNTIVRYVLSLSGNIPETNARAFKKHTGITPQEFRRLRKGQITGIALDKLIQRLPKSQDEARA